MYKLEGHEWYISDVIRNIFASTHSTNEIEVWLINSHEIFLLSPLEKFRLKAGRAEEAYLNHGEAQALQYHVIQLLRESVMPEKG